MIITLTGPSGVGKTTLLRGLLEAFPEAKMLESVTTRPKRESDLKRKPEYWYVSEEEFLAMYEREEFLWEVLVHGYHFGTRVAVVEEALFAEKQKYFSVLVIEKAEKLYKYAQEHEGHLVTEICSLYLLLENEAELKRRLVERGDTPDVEERIEECRSWNKKFKEAQDRFPIFQLDASKSKEEVLKQAIACIISS